MKVLFIAPLPPPVHGSAMVSQYIKDSKLVNEAFDCDFVNLSTSRRMDEIGKGGIKKILRFIGAYLSLFWKLLTRRYDLCYLAITCHGMGFLKDAPFVLLCKLFRRKVLIHQHNKGMSHCVERWPYRWLLPLVYRNTRVMLLSWHLYDDIAQVVRREQVVVCPNGIPQQSCDEDENENENCLAGNINLTQNTQNSQNTHCFARVGHPEENTTHYTLHTTQESSHTDSTDCTEGSCLRDVALNLTQNTQNSQNTHCFARVGHPDGEDVAELQAVACCPLPVDSIEKGDVKLLFLSNLIPSKGVYVLLDACKVLKERGMLFTCDFVGGETKEIDRAAFEMAVKEQGLEGIACYQGPKYGEEKQRCFAQTDIFVFPTFYNNECSPLVLMEAMQYRLPLVSTNEGGIPDIVVDGENGFVCERQDVNSLVAALERLIKDSALRTRMGEKGYARYRELYTLEAFEERFVEVVAPLARGE